MAKVAPSRPLDGETVTASELVRHFGHWQRRAVNRPVYVLNHGRPQFVLASVEFMGAVAGARTTPAAMGIDDLLDGLLDPVLVVSPDGVIVAAGRAARLHFGSGARPDAELHALMPREAADFLRGVVARVAASGIAERTELPDGGGDSARLELSVEPAPAGVVITGRAAGLADARDAALAQAAGLTGAVTALPGTAIATIGPRGYVTAPYTSLAALSGVAAATLATVRAVNLFSIASRVAVGDAIEAVFTTGEPVQASGELLTTEDGPLAVTLGLAPLRRGLATIGVLAIVTADKSNRPA